MSDLGERLIAAVQEVTGTHPGRRVLHAKGVGARGAFHSTGAAAGLTRAAHLQPGAIVPVEVRFSNGSGSPVENGFWNTMPGGWTVIDRTCGRRLRCR